MVHMDQDWTELMLEHSLKLMMVSKTKKMRKTTLVEKKVPRHKISQQCWKEVEDLEQIVSD